MKPGNLALLFHGDYRIHVAIAINAPERLHRLDRGGSLRTDSDRQRAIFPGFSTKREKVTTEFLPI